MRESGRSGQVDLIATANNLAYVPDVAEGPIVGWVFTSGPTQEEAALIQPACSFLLPPPDVQLDSLLTSGATFKKDGLLYSDFSYNISSGDTIIDPIICELLPVLCDFTGLPLPQSVDLIAGTGNVSITSTAGIPYFEALGTNWLWFKSPMSRAEVDEKTIQELYLRFDVTPVGTGKAIDKLWITESRWAGGFGFGRRTFSGDPSSIELTVSSGDSNLGSIIYENDEMHDFVLGGEFDSELLEISPQSKLTLEIDILLQPTEGRDDNGLQRFTLQLNVINVPDPGTASLSVLVACAAIFNRRKKIV